MLGRVFLRQMSSGGGHDFVSYGGVVVKRATLNDFPVPHGSWQTAYNAKQVKNNLMLAFGLSFLGGTFFYIYTMDPFQFAKMLAPRKFMHNPPMFESPVMEPNQITLAREKMGAAAAAKKK